MSHEINITNGKASAMYANKPAWHGLGTVVEGLQTWKETIEKAGLDWQVEKHQLLSHMGSKVAAWGIFRADTQDFLGAVGEQYTPIQNEYAFDFIDTLLETENDAHYDSAGALGKGERIFVSAKIPYSFKIDGTDDEHKTYLLFTTSHDGSLAAQCKLTDIRVVCNNTLQQALKLNGAFTKIKHTRQAEDKLERAKKMMKNAQDGVLNLKDKLDTLSKRILDKDTYVSCLDKIFPLDTKGQSSTRRDNVLKEITELFAHNDGNVIPEIKGTAYNLFNAVTDYTDHMRPTRVTENRQMYTTEQCRVETSIFGSGSQLKSKALDEIIKATEACKIREPKLFGLPPIKPTNGTIDNIANMVDF